jgi:hypothetical protein
VNTDRAALMARLADLIDDLTTPEVVELASLLDAMARRLGRSVTATNSKDDP